ncbi:MAG: hypothetical protein KDD82_13825 [Planctomycetes bacterium]|nr:hypothetical protein [Planctomycetota bacterium]
MTSPADAQYMRELETRCRLLERAFLIQEKQVWSQNMLKRLEQGKFLGASTDEEKKKTRQLLEGNLRVSREILDELALELGYESPTVFKLLDPEFVYGAPSDEIPQVLSEQLQKIDARERESGSSHIRSMFRELKLRHDEFLSEVQKRIRDDVDLHSLFATLTVD